LIQNQATSLFIFTMPDRLGASSIFHIDESQADPEQQLSLAQRALKVRQIGTKLITLAGGQFIHPIKAIIGGMTSGIKSEPAKEMLAEVKELLPAACTLFDEYWEMSLAMRERIGTWGDDQPAYYIASTGRTRPKLNSDIIRVLGPDGTERASFPPHLIRKYLNYEETEYSYAGQSSYEGQVMRANSLARINLANSMGTPCADDYMDKLTRTFGKPAHPILLFDLCRGIEMVYAFERAIEILSKDLDYEDPSLPYSPKDGEGYGLVEAPRGPLVHHYTVKDGLIEDAEFIIPTVHNMLAIERALMVAGERYITPQGINLELEKAVGRVVRAFDPCIACATQ
jgi:F420-non-reducing hydrogenase large subunit